MNHIKLNNLAKEDSKKGSQKTLKNSLILQKQTAMLVLPTANIMLSSATD